MPTNNATITNTSMDNSNAAGSVMKHKRKESFQSYQGLGGNASAGPPILE